MWPNKGHTIRFEDISPSNDDLPSVFFEVQDQNNRVQIPQIIDLQQIFEGKFIASTFVFELKGVICWEGEVESGFGSQGHYYGFFKHRDNWFFCSDTKVEEAMKGDRFEKEQTTTSRHMMPKLKRHKVTVTAYIKSFPFKFLRML